MKKTGKQGMKYLLNQNQMPEPDETKVQMLKSRMQIQAQSMDFLPWISFPKRMLRQVPYITSWVWLVQLVVLFLLGAVVRQDELQAEVAVLLPCVGSVLGLLLVVDVVRSYGCNMWEMEMACRYDLRQVTAMRMCIVGGTDLLILTAGGLAYGMRNGNIGEFGLYVVLPFLFSSIVYLWELMRFSRRYHIFLLAATGIMLNVLFGYGVEIYLQKMETGLRKWMPVFSVAVIVSAAVVLIYMGIRMCKGLKESRGEKKRWSLE